jgi:hypothetical protein
MVARAEERRSPHARSTDEEVRGGSLACPFQHGCDTFDLIFFGNIQIVADNDGGVHINWWAPAPKEGSSVSGPTI